MYDFATEPFRISQYLRKNWFSFLSMKSQILFLWLLKGTSCGYNICGESMHQVMLRPRCSHPCIAPISKMVAAPRSRRPIWRDGPKWRLPQLSYSGVARQAWMRTVMWLRTACSGRSCSDASFLAIPAAAIYIQYNIHSKWQMYTTDRIQLNPAWQWQVELL